MVHPVHITQNTHIHKTQYIVRKTLCNHFQTPEILSNVRRHYWLLLSKGMTFPQYQYTYFNALRPYYRITLQTDNNASSQTGPSQTQHPSPQASLKDPSLDRYSVSFILITYHFTYHDAPCYKGAQMWNALSEAHKALELTLFKKHIKHKHDMEHVCHRPGNRVGHTTPGNLFAAEL